MKKMTISQLLYILPIVVVSSYALLVNDYGFWRHDSWGYTYSEVGEFKENGRWLAPIFHNFMHDVPYYISWCLSILLLWFVGYTVASELLPTKDSSDKIFVLAISSSIVLTPSLFSQLNWPIHSFSAIFALAALTFMRNRFPRIPLVVIGTIVLFGIHQTFAFLTLLLLIRKPDSISHQSLKKSILNTLVMISLWASTIFFAYLISKAIQLFYFGYFPDLPKWRNPNAPHSLNDLIENITANLSTFINNISTIYSTFTVISIVLILFFTGARLAIRQEKERLKNFVTLLIFGIALYLSIYIFTAPIGVDIPFRSALVFGPGLLCFTIALFYALGSRFCTIVFLTLFLFNSHNLTYANIKWFSIITSDIVTAISEIEEVDSRFAKKVIIDITRLPQNKLWALDYSNISPNESIVFEGFQQQYRIVRAFNVLGYKKVHWCREGDLIKNSLCAKIENQAIKSKCSKINTGVCSMGITKDNYWILQFSR
jgi:hypothetical protein